MIFRFSLRTLRLKINITIALAQKRLCAIMRGSFEIKINIIIYFGQQHHVPVPYTVRTATNALV